MELYELISHLRGLINDTRKQGALLQSSSKWNMLCSSLDAIEDARSAIRAYTEQPSTDDTGLKYLQLYGLLQAMVLQQDAAQHISKSLDIPFELHPELRAIREIRNDSIGHPTRRDRRKGEPECYCLIVQMSICKGSFEYHRHTPTAQGTSFEVIEVNLTDVIQSQSTLIQETVDRVCKILEDEENQHRTKYMNEKLSDIFPQTTGYYFEKISDGIHRPGFSGLGKMHVDLIAEIVQKFKSALEERGLWENTDSIKYHYENISYPIEQLSIFFESRAESKLNNRDAEIFRSYVSKELDFLKEIAQEIDEEYEKGVARLESCDEIDRFLGHFKVHISHISKLFFKAYQKILYSCLLDTTANARFPTEGNKVRVCDFISECCSWPHVNRVSAPQLMMTLKRKGQESGKLFGYLSEIVSKWDKDKIVDCESDPMLEQLESIAVEGEKKFLSENTYLELFYRYRNYLIHNIREPGYSIELRDDGNSPYYHWMKSLDEPAESEWQLVFPVGFFQTLCETGLIGLEKYLRENGINPYEQYPLGNEWIRP
jgi:hypothetical protein